MPGTKENFQFIKGVGNVMKKPARKVGDSIAKGAKGMKLGVKEATRDLKNATRQVAKGMGRGIRKPLETLDQKRRKKFRPRKDIEDKRKAFRGGGICKRGKGRAYGKNS